MNIGSTKDVAANEPRWNREDANCYEEMYIRGRLIGSAREVKECDRGTRTREI